MQRTLSIIKPDATKRNITGEINQIIDRIERDGLTVIPLKLYFSKGRAKIEIALARGRKLHDKRQAIAKRESQRETERSMARNQRNRS